MHRKSLFDEAAEMFNAAKVQEAEERRRQEALREKFHSMLKDHRGTK